jgi:hypothetical protein
MAIGVPNLAAELPRAYLPDLPSERRTRRDGTQVTVIVCEELVDGRWEPFCSIHGHRPAQPASIQVQRHRVALHANLPRPGTLAGDRDRDRIVGIGLAAVADRQHPAPGRPAGRNVQHLFPISDQQAVQQRAADT